MRVGLLTAAFGKKTSFADVAAWAAQAGFSDLEVWAGPEAHLDPREVLKDDGRSVRNLLKKHKLHISSLAYYAGFTGKHEAYQQTMLALFQAAEALGTDTVCTFAGFPEPGKNKLNTIKEVLPKVFAPLIKEAERRKIKIAFENWFETNLQHLDHFAAVIDSLKAPHVGFNFDPSHLHWQGIDVAAAVLELEGRIFHTHAKDVLFNREKLVRLGLLDFYSSWQYSIPGTGEVPWGKYLRALRKIKYGGVLSIEHEDAAFGVEEGFEAGKKFLLTLI